MRRLLIALLLAPSLASSEKIPLGAREHRFLLDPLNMPLFAKLSEADGSSLPDESPRPVAVGRRPMGDSATLRGLGARER